MRDIVLAIIESYGYIGVFVLIAMENLFPPIPSEVILSFAGFATYNTKLTFAGVVAAATLGSVLGAMLLYAAGRFISVDKLSLVTKSGIGKALHLEREDIAKASAWFAAKGSKSVFFCRMVPIVRSLISIPAGMAKMPFLPFVWLTALGSTIWNILLVGLGALAGENWEAVNNVFQSASVSVKVLLIALLLIGAIVLLRRKKCN